jgi:hypothetical protein
VERELVTLNEKPVPIVAYRNTGAQTRALRKHKSTNLGRNTSTVTCQVCSGAQGDHKSTAEHGLITDGTLIEHEVSRS